MTRSALLRVLVVTAAAISAWLLLAAPASAGPCSVPGPMISGTPGDDVLVGTPANETIAGGAGDDVIRGLSGGDIICGGSGADVIYGGRERDVLLGGKGADLLAGGRGDDLLIAGGGEDRLLGGPASDELAPGRGADVSFGGAGVDLLTIMGPRAATLTITVSLAAGSMTGQGSTDEVTDLEDVRVFYWFGPVVVVGTGEDNEITSTSHLPGPFTFSGGGGDDFLRGSAGADTLRGEAGDDRLRESVARTTSTAAPAPTT